MSVIDVFELLFKSNAKQTEKDIDALDKKIADLAKKGTDRSDQEKKQLSELRKQRSEASQDLKDQTKVTDDLSSSLMKVGLNAVAAFASFSAIKSGITDAINFNAALEKTHLITGESVNQLNAYDAAFSQFGSNSGEFLAWFQQTSQEVQKTNGDVTNIIPNLKKLADQLRALPEKDAHQLFQIRAAQLGLPQDFFITLRQGGDAIDELAAKYKAFQDVNGETALKLQGELKSVAVEWRQTFTELTPVFEFILKAAKELAQVITVDVKGIKALFTGDWASVQNYINSTKEGNEKSKSSGSASSIAAPLPASNGSLPLGIRNNNPGNLRSWGGVPTNGGFAHFASLQDGLSAEDKQLQLYGNRGINTIGGIVSKWAPSSENNTAAYIAAVSKMTGFSANQALDLSNPATRRAIANAINSQENGASYGNLLLASADRSPINSSSSATHQSNINIQNITVHSQATDANGVAGDIKRSLNEHLAYLAANVNDGIAK